MNNVTSEVVHCVPFYFYPSTANNGSSFDIVLSLETGPTDLSMKSVASGSTHSNSSNRAMPCAQLSPTEIGAVRQLIAGYRESAAFLLRSADELENLILQQN